MRLVRDIMTTTVRWVQPGASARAAAALMSRHRIGSLLVEDGDGSAAIVTETDLVRRVLAENKNPTSVTVDQIMTSPLITVDEHQSVKHAEEVMAEYEIRHLGVTASAQVVGLISVRDLLREVQLLPIAVERMMTRMPVIVPTMETVRNSAALMAQSAVSGLLVCGQRRQPRGIHFSGFARSDIAGIATGTDLVRRVIDKDLDPNITPILEVMARPIYTVSASSDVMTAFNVMARAGVRHLGVVEGDEITGLLSVEDVIEPVWLHAAAG
ncbi:MAG TPA: CBS domain-containing protein [Nitrospiria bacterium]|nr:CBS domain-containing protein [Nitrospiria bacterium]